MKKKAENEKGESGLDIKNQATSYSGRQVRKQMSPERKRLGSGNSTRGPEPACRAMERAPGGPG